MNTINHIWDIYRTCWTETNSEKRKEKLEDILTVDFEYKDPNYEVSGYAQLSDYMKEFQEQFEGASFITRDIKFHHNRCLVNWSMVDDENEVLSNGTSFVLCEKNKLKQITGFFEQN